jgi:hypothetical protein
MSPKMLGSLFYFILVGGDDEVKFVLGAAAGEFVAYSGGRAGYNGERAGSFGHGCLLLPPSLNAWFPLLAPDSARRNAPGTFRLNRRSGRGNLDTCREASFGTKDWR